MLALIILIMLPHLHLHFLLLVFLRAATAPAPPARKRVLAPRRQEACILIVPANDAEQAVHQVGVLLVDFLLAGTVQQFAGGFARDLPQRQRIILLAEEPWHGQGVPR